MFNLMKKNNFKKLTLKRGISLIALVITIVVIIILAGAVMLSIANSSIISNANIALIKSDLSSVQDAYLIYIDNLKIKELKSVKGIGIVGKINIMI